MPTSNPFATGCVMFLLLVCSFGQAASPQSQEPDSSVAREAVFEEIKQTREAMESILAATQAQLAQIDSARKAFQKNSGSMLEHVRALRFVLQQRQNALQRAQDLLVSYNDNDTASAAGRDYWKNFAENLQAELATPKWSEEKSPVDSSRLDSLYRNALARVSEGLSKYPVLQKISLPLIKLVGKPLTTAELANGLREVQALRGNLSRFRKGPELYKLIKKTVPAIKTSFQSFDKLLLPIETALVDFNAELGKVALRFEMRLAKTQALLNSLQVLAKNFRNLQSFQAAEVRQQLIFLRQQNQILDYEHRVLKSYHGEIEDALARRQWQIILAALAKQDPDFGSVDLEKNAYVIFIGANDLDERFLLHEERAQPSEYLYAIDDFCVLWLEDNPQETYRITVSVEVLQSEFELTFGQFKTLAEARAKGGEGVAPEPTLFFYGMKKVKKISDPARINIGMQRVLTTAPGTSDTPPEVQDLNEVFQASYKVHEKSFWHVSVGLAAGFVKPSNFTVAGRQLKASVKGNSELDEHLYALLNYHPFGHDIDRFGRYREWDYRKLMVQAGLNVSKDPLNRLYIGLGYRAFKEVHLDVLHYWWRQPRRNQTVALEDAASLDDAKQAFDQVYRGGNFAVGLSFYPKRIFGFLGL